MDPHRILNVGRGASKRDIIQAAAIAMRKRQHTGKEVAEAQKALMDPVSRAAHEFVDLLNIAPLQDSLDVAPPGVPADAPSPPRSDVSGESA